ncbi:cupin domain-containing protein [Galbibacter sp. PAP.153]|uniref:cupin domain-containing protein n=1 Tax=Galbibacter sp. PAP.153 TaxID=3104623 RepID=UPI003008D677
MLEKQDWDSIPEEQVNPSMSRKLLYGEKIMIAKMKFKDGFVVPQHSHENEQITQVEKGTMRFWFGANKEQEVELKAGESIVIPPNVPHEAMMIGDVEETDTWAPPRKDWLDGTDNYLRE